MGRMPGINQMPASKFTNPKNGDVLAADEPFTITMAINNLETGAFTNAQRNYFMAPQQLNADGIIVGHSHVVIEKIDALDSIAVTDPTEFYFFKGLNDPAVDGILSAEADKGLEAGVYRMSSINAAANHQPVLAPIAQHGSLDDAVYFTVE